MSSQHRIDTCTLQITLSPRSDLSVVKLLAQDKARLLDAILVVCDREIPDHHTITLSKIHLDLGTVSRHDFIPKLTERLIALLTMELKNFIARTLPVSPHTSSMIEETIHRTPASANNAQPNLPVAPFTIVYVPPRWTSVTADELRFAVMQYFQTGTFPRAFEFLRPMDVDALAQHLADENARSFTQAISSLIGIVDFQQRASKYLQYETLVKIFQPLPAVRKSLQAWLAWMDSQRDKNSTWPNVQEAKLLFLQYLTAPSVEEQARLQRLYILKSLQNPSGDTSTDPAAPVARDEHSVQHSLAAMAMARGMAHESSASAFTHVQFYYRFGYFSSQSKQLHVKDLDTLVYSLLDWDSDQLTRYILTLLDTISYTIRLAETLSTRTLKTILSASAQASDALAEWTLWEHVITSLLEKSFFTTVADKVALLQYVGAPTDSVRKNIIYEYLLFSFAQQQLSVKLHLMLDIVHTFTPPDERAAAARTRIIDFLTGFAARENTPDAEIDTENLKAFRQYLADTGSYVAPQAPDHPLHGRWIDLETRVRDVLEDANVPGRDGLLRQLLFSYGDFLRLHGTTTWTAEHFQRYMLHAVEHLLAAATLAANAQFLLARIDATPASTIVYRGPVLHNMVRAGIRQTVSDIPALREPKSFTLFWDAALADEAAVFSLLHEADIPASFWSELSELLSFDQLHRLLSILAPFQYQDLHATGVLAEDRATTREAFLHTLTTLHDARFTIGTGQLIDRVLREASVSPSGNAPSQSEVPAAATGSSDNASVDESSFSTEEIADELIRMLAEDIARHRAAAAGEHWKELYRYFDGSLAPYARKKWSSQQWRDSLALDADLGILINFTTLLWHNEPSYHAWRNFTQPHRHRERWLRAMHRYYFDFLAGARGHYDAAVFTKSLADFAETLDVSADGAPKSDQEMQADRPEHHADDVNVLLAELYITTTRREPLAARLWRSLYARYRQELVHYIHIHDHPEPLHDSLALDAGLDILIDLSTSLYQREASYSFLMEATKSNRQNVELLRKIYRYYFRSVRNDTPEIPMKPFHYWLESLADTSDLPPIIPATAEADTSTSPYSAADVIIYYLKTGLFIPGSGTEDTTALTTLTTRYFQEVPADDNRVVAVVHEHSEVLSRLTPLLPTAALSWLHARDASVDPHPHYTTDRIATLQQTEATLHYWLYGQWPWWYTTTLSPAETASSTLENHLELLVERFTTSGHEVTIVQKIASQLPQAVFLKMVEIRFPAVAGFVTRIILLLEQLPPADEHSGTRPSAATFAFVYDYLAHHTHDAAPFSALHFLSTLARHQAKALTISAPVWIDRMVVLAQGVQHKDAAYWSLHSVLTSMQASFAEAAGDPIGDHTQSPAAHISSESSAPHSADRGFARASSFKDAFVAYLRMGIIPVHTLESGNDKSAFIQQLHHFGMQEPAWLTTTLKSLYKNTIALDAYLQRADPLITDSIVRALAGTRQEEFGRWQLALENFLNTLPDKSATAASALQTSSVTTRTFLPLLLQRPVAKVTAIQYAESVLVHSLQHNLATGLDVLSDKIQQYKESPQVYEHVAIALEVAHAQLAAQARTALLQSLTNAITQKHPKVSVPEKGTPIAVEGAGIVLMAPFFYMYFNRLGMTENNSFKTTELAIRAVHLLHYLASGQTAAPRQALLYKLLCGVDLRLPLDGSITVTDHEKEVSESLLHGVLQNWTSLQSKSIDALRETFLQRVGRLEENEMGWNVTVERKSMDILVDWIPWSFSLVKLSWMEKSLAVHWQSDQYRDLMPTNP
jgi:hypothetical protein